MTESIVMTWHVGRTIFLICSIRGRGETRPIRRVDTGGLFI